MKLALMLTVDGDYFQKVAEWLAVPRVGDLVEPTGDGSGWTEPVRAVWWNAGTGEARVDLGSTTDAHGEGLAESLRAAGWQG